MSEMRVKMQYPFNEEYDYVSKLERIDLDAEREYDIIHGRGFVISEPQSIKKDLKDPNGIFSTRYGQTLQDVNPFADRYKCECGKLTSRIHHGITCPTCNTKVKYIDDDFKYFGWICLKDPYFVIHPNLYKSIEFLIGAKNLTAMICPIDEKNEDGFTMEPTATQLKEGPFHGIGMIDFKERFIEILDYYKSKNPNKKEYYDDIIANKDKLFIQSIPVYTTHLRAFSVEDKSLFFEGVNAIYNVLSKLAASVNRDQLRIFRKKKPKNLLLYDIQTKYNELYKEIEAILAQKKGSIRALFGGRYNFSSRSVIIPNPKLRIDEVTLPYNGLVELLQQRIINILQKSYNITYSEAYKIWYKSQIVRNDRVYAIIEGLIKDQRRGLPILINRNPTIKYGGILQMFVVGISNNFTMNIPVQVLKKLAADFDGDCLNILLIINKAFLEQAVAKFNPRNAMFISRNDGYFDNELNHCRDSLINANSLVQISRDKYSPEQLEKIRRLKEIA